MKKTKTKKRGRPRKSTPKKQDHNPSTLQLFAGLMAIMITIGVTYYAQSTIEKEIALSDDYNYRVANFDNIKNLQNKEIVLTSGELEKEIEKQKDMDKAGEYEENMLMPPLPEEDIPMPSVTEENDRFPRELNMEFEDEDLALHASPQDSARELDIQTLSLDKKNKKGDVNADGVLDNKDIDEALEILNGFAPYTKAADLYPEKKPDRKITVDDIDNLVRLVKRK